MNNNEKEYNTVPTDQFVDHGAQYETQSTYFQGITLEQGILYLNKVTMPPTLNCPGLSEEETISIKQLLQEWDLEFLTPILIKECIDADTLKLLTPLEATEIMRHVPLGYRVKFLHHLRILKGELKTDSLDHPIILTLDSPKTESSNMNIIELADILKLTFLGRNLTKYYDVHKFLTDIHRKDLREEIYSYVIDHNIKWALPMVEALANQIVELFPTEIKEVYYSKVNSKVGGVLFHNFYNFKRNVILPKSTKNEKIDSIFNDGELINNLEINQDDVSEHINALITGKESTWAETEGHWQATCAIRLRQFKEGSTENVFFNWPQYKEKLGYKLINIDYAYMYPHSTSMKEVFQNIKTKLLEIYDTRIKDISNKKILKQLRGSWDQLNENSQACVVFYLLPSVVIPTTRKVTRNISGENTIKKFSIKDSQESLINVCENITGIESFIQLKKDSKKPIQPLILIEDDLFNINNTVVFIDNIKYKFEYFLDAVDSVFKMHQVFNIKYPDETEVLWNFIQNFFYNVKTKYDIKSSAAVVQLIADLSNK